MILNLFLPIWFKDYKKDPCDKDYCVFTFIISFNIFCLPPMHDLFPLLNVPSGVVFPILNFSLFIDYIKSLRVMTMVMALTFFI